jgi:hypothetical protein
VNITAFHVGPSHIRIANDRVRDDEPDCWKTSINGRAWTIGTDDLGEAIQEVLDTLGVDTLGIAAIYRSAS